MATSKIVTITPEWAAKVLERNDKNRTLKRFTLLKYKALIKQGLWVVNGDSIRISKTGRLLDGQHRLHAVVQTGCSIQSFVVEGLPDEVFDTIDDGARRSAGDVLHIEGHASPAKLAAALGVVDKVKLGYMYSNNVPAEHAGNSRIRALLELYPTISRSVAVVGDAGKLCPPSILAGLHYWFSAVDQDSADAFIGGIISGAGLETGDPVLALRACLVLNKGSKAKLPRVDLTARIIKAWNFSRKGLRVKLIKWGRDEVFPEIDGVSFERDGDANG